MPKFLLAIPLFILAFLPIHAQQIYFTKIGLKEGLPSEEVYFSLQDHSGQIWFCTDRGMVRYNGHSYTTFNQNNGLCDNTFFTCALDEKNRIWTHSLSGCISIIDGDSAYDYPYNDTLLKYSNHINNIQYASNDTLFVEGVYHSFFITPSGEVNFNLPNFKPGRHAPITFEVGHSILHRRSGNYPTSYTWYQNGNQIHDTLLINLKLNHSASIQFLELSSGQVAFSINRYLLIFTKDSPLQTVQTDKITLNALFEDERGLVWVGTRNGVEVFDSKNEFKKVHHFFKDIPVTHINQDKEKGYWFTTATDGVYYCPSIDVLNYPNLTPSKNKRISSLEVVNNKLYAGFYGTTLIELDSNHNVTTLLDSYDHINNLATIDDQLLIIFNLKGIQKVDIQNGNKLIPIIGNSLPAHYYDQNELVITDRRYKSQKTILYHISPSLDTFSIAHPINTEMGIQSMLKMDDKFWFGYKKGIKLYDAITQQQIPIQNLPETFESIRYNQLRNVNDHLIAGTNGKGILLLGPNETIQVFDEKTGLANNFVYDFAISNDTIWVGTNKGISVLKLNAGKLELINTIDHLDGLGSLQIHKLKLWKDKIWAGTNNGLYYFDKNLIPSEILPAGINLRNLYVNNLDFKKSIVQNHKLSHTENNLSFEIDVIGYREGNNYQFTYQLEGYDANWKNSNSGRIEYSSLPHGSYTFKAKIPQTDYAIKIPFVIQAPFYKTLLFKFIFLSFLFISTGLIIRYRIRQIKTQTRLENEKQIAQKESELLEQELISKKLEEEILVEKMKGKQKELIAYITRDATYQNLILSIKDRIVGIDVASKKDRIKIQMEVLKTIKNGTNIERNWQHLKSHFDMLYPEFIEALVTEYPQLTKNEIKHCIYIKLQLDTKTIAEILHINPESVRMTRYRIKKKLNLEQETDIYSYLNQFKNKPTNS